MRRQGRRLLFRPSKSRFGFPARSLPPLLAGRAGSLPRCHSGVRCQQSGDSNMTAKIIPLRNARDWEYFDKRLTELRVNDVASIIERGRVLIEAKEELAHGSFEATTKRHFDIRTAQCLMKITRHPVLSNANHGSLLPPSWRTLYELTKLPDDVL